MEIEKLVRYLRSDFKNLTIAILLIAVYILAKDNKELSLKCMELQDKRLDEMEKQRIEDKLDRSDYKELACSYKELLFTLKEINNENAITKPDSAYDHNLSIFNPERKQH